MSGLENVEDLYPLTPMQALMLLNATSSGSGRDALLTQFRYVLRGPLVPGRFEKAWQQLIDRHPALRTIFLYNGLQKPIQIVRQTARLPFAYEDWSVLPGASREASLDAYCQDDAARGFDLTQAPLMRVALIRIAPEVHYFIWTTHHLVLDRWSIDPLFAELGVLLEGDDTAPPRMPPPAPFSRYLRWLQDRDETGDRIFWQDTFRGFRPGPRLVRQLRAGCASETEYAEKTLAQDHLAAARALAAANATTLSIVVQAAWSLVLNRLTGTQDVCYGLAVSGRPPGVDEVERIPGAFVSNVPSRAVLAADHTISALLSAMSRTQRRRARHEHCSPIEVLRFLDSPRTQLFDSLLVWLSGTAEPALAGLEVEAMPGRLQTGYPVTVGVNDARNALSFSISIRAGSELRVNAATLAELLCEALDVIITAGRERPLSELRGFRGTLELADFSVGDDSPPAHPFPQVAIDHPQRMGRECLDESDLVEMLTAEWRAVLADCPTPGPDDDFFELGGDSLDAVSLHASIEVAVRLEVPLVGLFHRPTIAGMAEFLAAGDWPIKAGILTPLRQQGCLPPLFCIASPEVNTLGFVVLTRHLNDERPVYVLQAPPAADMPERLSPALLPVLAEQYVDAMRQAQPRGPYHLLGMCTGCHLALDMARILDQQGDRLAFLGMINTWAQFTVSRLYHLERLRSTIRWYGSRARGMLGRDPDRSRVTRFGTWPVSKVGTGGSSREPGVDQRPAHSGGAEDNVIDWIDDIGWAHLSPSGLIEPIDHSITVFRVRAQQFWRIRDTALGWGRFSRTGAEAIALGNHDHQDILREPHVRRLAYALEGALGEAPTGVGGSLAVPARASRGATA